MSEATFNGNGHRSHARKAIWAALSAAAAAGLIWLSARSATLTWEVYGLPPRVERLEKHIKEDARDHDETNRLLRELIEMQKRTAP